MTKIMDCTAEKPDRGLEDNILSNFAEKTLMPPNPISRSVMARVSRCFYHMLQDSSLVVHSDVPHHNGLHIVVCPAIAGSDRSCTLSLSGCSGWVHTGGAGKPGTINPCCTCCHSTAHRLVHVWQILQALDLLDNQQWPVLPVLQVGQSLAQLIWADNAMLIVLCRLATANRL
jgi:hypothetical protein